MGRRETGRYAPRRVAHPWRREYGALLEDWIRRLADNPEVYEQFERIKADVLDSQTVDSYLAWLVSETETKLQLDWAADDTMLARTLERLLLAAGEWIEGNEGVRDGINRSARQLVMNTVVPHRDEIGTYIADVVTGWDEKTLVERLELTVGKDLQFICINGTLVGGAVGLVLYVITQWLG